ncbi:MAG: hypothetical protein V7765_05780 [Oleispira sp.]
MESNEVSANLTLLAESLDLGSSTGTNWQQFLNCFVEITGANSACLGFADINTDFYVKSNVSKRGSISLTCELIPGVCQLDFQFETELCMTQANQFWLQLVEPIREIMKLGINWHERHEIQNMTNTFSQSLKIGTAELGTTGKLKNRTGIMDDLIEAGVLTVSNGCIQLIEDPCWITNVQKDMANSAAEYQSVYRIVKCGDITYRCILEYQRNSANGWKAKNNQFTLLFYANSEQQNSRCLKSLFAMSESEAEIAACFSEGLSAEEVSVKTGYKVSTIYSYIKDLYKNLGINKQSQLTAAIWPELPLLATG